MKGWLMFAHSGPLELKTLQVAEINPLDIAHGLANTNQFNGQTRKPIPVLWHSLMTCEVMGKRPDKQSVEALFRNAADAYVGTSIGGLVTHGDELESLRLRIQATCFTAAGVPNATTAPSAVVQEAHELMLRYEHDSEWGHHWRPSWHVPLTYAKQRPIEEALKAVGPPPDTPEGRAQLRTMFLTSASYVLAADAPMRSHLALPVPHISLAGLVNHPNSSRSSKAKAMATSWM